MGNLRGKPLDAQGLARRLRKYEVRPHQIKINKTDRRGYSIQGTEKGVWGLFDAWSRYLPLSNPEKGVTDATAATDQVSGAAPVAGAVPVALRVAGVPLQHSQPLPTTSL